MSFYISLPKEVNEILENLEKKGFEAYIVGGCVRDSVLKRTPKDWDITTNAKPTEIKAIFKKTIDVGIEHGTVAVLINKKVYEVTTYRLDGNYTDKRHPDKVEFTELISKDLRRRDFTINAMAYSPKRGLVDLFFGVRDLENKIVSCVGNPKSRFEEDALRILRAIRFAAELGFSIDEKTILAIEDKAPNLAYVSKERIFIELNKILLSDNMFMMNKIFEFGVYRYLTDSFVKIKNKKISKEVKNLEKKVYLRWAYFLYSHSDKFLSNLLKELKSDNETLRRASLLLRNLHRSMKDEYDVKVSLNILEEELFSDLISLQKVLYEEGKIKLNIFDCESFGVYFDNLLRIKNEVIKTKKAYNLKMLNFTGKDLINLGINPSKELGNILNDILNKVMLNEIENKKEDIFKYLKNVLFK